MNKCIVIDNHQIGASKPVFTIAEMSANHLMDYERAKKIMLAAKQSGADAIKLQTYRPDTITLDCRGEEFMATKGSPWEGMNLYDLYKEAYTPWEWHKGLFEYAKEIGLTCFSSPFDLTAVDFLEELNTPAYKIASFEITDIPLIRKVAKTGKPIIISTGIAEIADIDLALKTCRDNGNDNVILLKCVSEYPTPYSEMNLRTITNMRETFDCVVGLSDHSMGDTVDVAAVALGACVIEKHLTLKREDGGPDGSFSMEPEEYREMVNSIRNVEQALGTVRYELTDKQRNSRGRSRSLYVSKDIKKGDIFSPENIKSIRPGYGLHTKYYDEILGRKSACDLKKGTAMKWNYID
ncbi:MAG: pseudaminic acid synthase [Acetatifactor sp.]|nr:pseudaminic acid synthase [Acetatifactor sp.]